MKVWLQYDFVLNSLVYASLTEMAVMFDMRPPDVGGVCKVFIYQTHYISILFFYFFTEATDTG